MPTQDYDPTQTLPRIINFLDSIGITVVATPLEGSTFLPGIEIANGTLLYDPARIEWPGDLLHEAGHIATMTAALRPLLNGAIDNGIIAPHASEVEATAWAYAAIVAIGLDAAVLFHAGGYHGASAQLIFTYTNGVYPGVAGLCAAGLVASPAAVQSNEAPAYPQMLRWLRD